MFIKHVTRKEFEEMYPVNGDSKSSKSNISKYVTTNNCIDCKPIVNGEPDANVYSSKELVANADACGNAEVDEIRAQWSTARVTG